MGSTLTVFIDEAGDPGIKDGIRYRATRHEWLCLSAVVVRSERESEVETWVGEMREVARARQADALHYHRIALERRTGVSDVLGSKPVRLFCMTSHKSNMREHLNPRLGKLKKSDEFYNWCMRLLFERLTDWCAAWQKREIKRREPVRIIFSKRGGHDYDHLFAYFDTLRMQREAGTLFLKSSGLDPELLVRDLWSVTPSADVPGLQLADVSASAFYQAANSNSPSWNLAPAKALRPIVAKDRRGQRANYGLTVWPLRQQSELPDASRPIFEFYGYKFS